MLRRQRLSQRLHSRRLFKNQQRQWHMTLLKIVHHQHQRHILTCLAINATGRVFQRSQLGTPTSRTAATKASKDPIPPHYKRVQAWRWDMLGLGRDQIRRVEEKHGGKKKLALADWPIGLQKTYDSSSNFWEPRCCPNWAKSCRRKPGNEAWASKASIEQTSKSLFWSSSHRPNGTKWLSESQVLSGNKKWKEKKVLLSESACAKASRSRHLEPTPWRNRCLCVCYPPSYEIICQAKSSGNIYTCGV